MRMKEIRIMTVIIFIYVLGLVLTALLIRFSNDEELKKAFKNNEGSLNTALLLWPVFLVTYFFIMCRRLTKIK